MRKWGKSLVLPLVLQLSGCFSIHAHRQQGKGEEARIAVAVFPDDSRRRAGQPGPEGVLAELERWEEGHWRPVFRSLASRWTVKVPAGKYQLRFPARLGEDGQVLPLSSKPRKLVVHPGELVQVEAVLEHLPKALVVAGVVVAAVVVVALSKWLRDQDLPKPPPLPPELVEATWELTVALALEPWPEAGDRAAPTVTSHFPPKGAEVPAGPLRIVWVFSEPLRPTSLDPQKIHVLGESSGLLPGVASYDPQRWWVLWESQKPLANEKVHVTLEAGAVEDLAGNPLAVPSSFSLRLGAWN